MARVLGEWSAVLRVFNRAERQNQDELDLSRTLELAASSFGDGGEPLRRFPRGTRTIPSGQRLAAVAVLGEREARLSAVQRLALVDAAAWWLSDPSGGHVASKSFRYSTTLGAIRGERRAYRQRQAAEHARELLDDDTDTTLVVSYWEFAGVGYLTNGDAALAVSAAARARAQRQAARDAA